MTATTTFRRWPLVGAIAVLSLVAAGCGDSDDKKATVTAVDYRFQNLPKTAKAGTVLTLENKSTKELHELVAIRLLDTERRPAAELVGLPEAEQEALSSGPPAAVLLAPPGGAAQIKAVGDGTLTEPGRYLVICAIPTGADPAAYLAASQAGGDGPPDVPGGPPHVAQGMFGEITVK